MNFDEQIKSLARLLGQRAIEARKLDAAKTYPDFRAGVCSIITFIAFKLTPTEWAFLHPDDYPTAGILVPFLVLILLTSLSAVFALRTVGVTKREFWRDAFAKRQRDNYPFTQLLRGLEMDLQARHVLTHHSTEAVAAVNERISTEENELRERLAWFGSPSVILIAGSIGAAWTAWQKFTSEPNLLGFGVFVATVAVLLLGVATLRLRLLLIGFTQSRALLMLELSSRKSASTVRS